MGESQSFSKAPGYYHWIVVVFIYLFVCLFIFSVNKLLVTTVNKTFYNSSLSKFFWHVEAVLQRCSRGGWSFADVLLIFGGLSVRGCNFNKVAKRLCWDRVSAYSFLVGLLHVWRASFLKTSLEDCFWAFNLLFLISYTFEDFRVLRFFVILISL